jgi:rubrerythrin
MATDLNLGEFSKGEAFELAAIVEQEGNDFYECLFARTAFGGVKNELGFLRDEEAKNKAFFLEQLRIQGRSPQRGVRPEHKAILEHEFIEPLRKLFSSSDIDDNFKTLGFGMALEQKSIELYGAMKRLIHEPHGVEIDQIIAEEEGHWRKLQLLRARY